jgi:hypothetical protein
MLSYKAEGLHMVSLRWSPFIGFCLFNRASQPHLDGICSGRYIGRIVNEKHV